MQPTPPARARIITAPPVDGNKAELCRSGDARVSMVLRPRQYAGMVEWLQKSPRGQQRDPASFFRINLDGTKFNMLYSPRDPINPVMRFLSLQFAQSVFPESLSPAGELRVSYEDGRVVSAIYSGNPRGTLPNPAEVGVGVQAARDSAYSAEPLGLDFGLRSLELSGLVLSEPGAFCDRCDSRLALFEIRGIRLKDAFMAAAEYSSEPEDSLALLSLIYSAMLRDYAKKNTGFLSQYCGYSDRGFDEIADSAFRALVASVPGPSEGGPRSLPGGAGIFCGFRELLHSVHSLAAQASSGSMHGGRKTAWPVSVDPALV